MTGKRRADGGVVNRLLGARELGARLRHRRRSAGVLVHQPFVIAFGGEAFFKQFTAATGVGFCVLRVRLGALERGPCLIEPQTGITVVEQQQRLARFDGVAGRCSGVPRPDGSRQSGPRHRTTRLP